MNNRTKNRLSGSELDCVIKIGDRMWVTNPIAFFGWIFVTIYLFSNKAPALALIYSVMGAFLFLPMSTIDMPIPLLPDINKTTAVAYGILLGQALSGANRDYDFKFRVYDLPMLAYCTIIPIMSSLSNGLGLIDGVSRSINLYFSWGIFYWSGRRYFNNIEMIYLLVKSILVGAIICIPMVFYEVRMSPQLHSSVYGFFQHSFAQTVRWGGYRPFLFMQHGLMVALWMSVATIVSFWSWRSGIIDKIFGIPIAFIFFFLALSTFLCKSSGALVFMVLGIGLYYAYNKKRNTKLLIIIVLIIPAYFIFRLSNFITIAQIERITSRIFSSERVASLVIRLWQENMFGSKALLRPLFGWGWMDRAWPMDDYTGELLIPMVDPLWIITLGTSGLIGLFASYIALGIGPLRVFRISGKSANTNEIELKEYKIVPIVLSLVVTVFLLDSLQNAMVAPIYIVCAGALTTYYLTVRDSMKIAYGKLPLVAD